MNTLTIQQLFDAGVHYGHLSKKWNPSFKPFIFMKKGDYHLIDVKKTLIQLQEAGEALKAILAKGGKVLFVGCKKQASPVVTHVAETLEQPYVTKRWLGGTLTNFATFRRRIKQLATTQTTGEAPKESKRYLNLTKKERLIEDRTKKKQASLLGGMTVLKRLPSALFVVDVNLECTAVREAKKLGLPIFAIVDSNASPDPIDYPIACNDDKRSAIKLVLDYLAVKMAEGNELWISEKGNRDNTRTQEGENEEEGKGQSQPRGRKRIGGVQAKKTILSPARAKSKDNLAVTKKGQPARKAKPQVQKEGAKVTAKAATTAKTTKEAPKATATKPAAAKEGAKVTAKAATTAKTTKEAPKATATKPAAAKKDAEVTAKAATTAKTTKEAPKATATKPAAAKEGAKVTAKAATTAKTTKAAPKATATKPAAAKKDAEVTAKAATTAKTTKAAPKATATKPAAAKKDAEVTAKAATTAKTTKEAPKATATKPAAAKEKSS